jgi:DNA-binding MarR family transcriptional regulator
MARGAGLPPYRNRASYCIHNKYESRDHQERRAGMPGIHRPAAEPGDHRSLRRRSRPGRIKGEPIQRIKRNCESAGNAAGGTREVACVDESTLSRNVARMCARGWLRLEPGDDDRRSHQIKLTEKGMALLRRGFPAWQKAQNQVVHRLGSDGVTALRSIVKSLRRKDI